MALRAIVWLGLVVCVGSVLVNSHTESAYQPSPSTTTPLGLTRGPSLYFT